MTCLNLPSSPLWEKDKGWDSGPAIKVFNDMVEFIKQGIYDEQEMIKRACKYGALCGDEKPSAEYCSFAQ